MWMLALKSVLAKKLRLLSTALSVLLGVAFLTGTLVFTDTMNTTFDKLFAATSSDVTVSAKGASDSGETTSDNGKPPVMPASVLGKVREAQGVKTAEGTVFSTSVTVVDADKDSLSPSGGGAPLASSYSTQPSE